MRVLCSQQGTYLAGIASSLNHMGACDLQGPAIPMIRRHTKGDGEIHFEPAMRVISGNYVTAKRRCGAWLSGPQRLHA